MRREGDRIIFDSNRQKKNLISMIDIGDEDFYMRMLRLMEKASRERHKAWSFIIDTLKEQGELAEDEIVVLDFTVDEFRIEKVDRKTGWVKKEEEDEHE